MGEYFTRAHYENKYREALTSLEHIKTRREGLKSKLFFSSEEDRPAVQAEIDAAEKEYQEQKAEVEALRVAAMTGEYRQATAQEDDTPKKKPFGGFNPGRFRR